jgi:tetratricopeptide (TPR) repeat protein
MDLTGEGKSRAKSFLCGAQVQLAETEQLTGASGNSTTSLCGVHSAQLGDNTTLSRSLSLETVLPVGYSRHILGASISLTQADANMNLRQRFGPPRFIRSSRIAATVVLISGCGFFSDKNAETSTGKHVDSAVPDTIDQHLASLTPDQWLGLSLALFQKGHYLESIGAAQSAAYIKPDFAPAYTNIGAAYAALHMWDPAITAAQQALRLDPNSVLARNNLAWATEQKRVGAK